MHMSKYHPTLHYLYSALVGAESVLGIKINGAQAIVRRGDEVLLIKTTYRPYWEFPGGKIEDLEAPESAAVRETKEEAYVFVRRIERKLGTYTRKYFFTKITIHVYVAGEWEELPLWKPTLEIGARQFFPITDLPSDISPATKKRIAELLSGEQSEFTGTW
jgi:8-oxo-dGTP pyrophosphatase MutT (NUDIX family)